MGDVIEGIFQSCSENQGLLTEALVKAGLLSDWELSKIACEVFAMPFMPVDVHKPVEQAREGLDHEFLKRWCLVPLARNADLLTVAIPGAISPQTYEELVRMSGCQLAIVIGSVTSNRHWLDSNL